MAPPSGKKTCDGRDVIRRPWHTTTALSWANSSLPPPVSFASHGTTSMQVSALQPPSTILTQCTEATDRPLRTSPHGFSTVDSHAALRQGSCNEHFFYCDGGSRVCDDFMEETLLVDRPPARALYLGCSEAICDTQGPAHRRTAACAGYLIDMWLQERFVNSFYIVIVYLFCNASNKCRRLRHPHCLKVVELLRNRTGEHKMNGGPSRAVASLRSLSRCCVSEWWSHLTILVYRV